MHKISFGGNKSKRDYRTVKTSRLRDMAAPLPPKGKVPLYGIPCTNTLCSQKRNGICTACGVRMAAEEQFADGIRLSEYWLYLIGKTMVESNTWEGSSILTMLKAANKIGIPSQSIEKDHPLNVDGSYADLILSFNSFYSGKVPQAVLDDASRHRIPGYAKLDKVDPILIAREVDAGKVVVCRFAVGDNTYMNTSGFVSWLARDLLPLRAPKRIEGGHIWCANEYDGLTESQILNGPNSWSEEWCGDRPEGYKGYWSAIFRTQKPYFTEAWTINDIPKEIKEEIKVLPPPIWQGGLVINWYDRWVYLLKKLGLYQGK